MLYSWFQHITFAHPQAFVLLLILPLLFWWYRTKISESSLMVTSVRSFGPSTSWKPQLRYLPMIFRLATVACLIVVVARPQTRNDQQMVSGEGVDIMLCMDVSGSMLAQDFEPNRLEAMKQVAVNFVDRRPTDRIGLVIFAGESFTSSPITMDRVSLKAQIYNAQSGYLADGTAIGDGLATSVERLKSSKAKSRVIILLTDGENQGGLIDPYSAKEIAKAIGIKVYTIGMGTEGFAPAPTRNETGDITMQQQRVNIDEKLLREIASETGGLYFRARDNISLQKVYAEIDKLEKSKIEITALKRYREEYLPFAIAAFFLFLIEIVLRYVVFKKFP